MAALQRILSSTEKQEEVDFIDVRLAIINSDNEARNLILDTDLVFTLFERDPNPNNPSLRDVQLQLIAACFSVPFGVDWLKINGSRIAVMLPTYDVQKKETVLRALEKYIRQSDSGVLEAFRAHRGLLVTCVHEIADRSVPVASQAQKLVQAICSQSSAVAAELIFHNVELMLLLENFSNAKEDSTVRMRVHELTANLCATSVDLLNYCTKTTLLDNMLKELSDNNNDVLSQLNCLEILATMASSSPSALQYLHNTGILATLHDMLATAQQAPEGGFLFPGIIKFFGYLSRVDAQQCSSAYPRFLQCVFQLVFNFEQIDIAQRLLGFDTLGLFASTNIGKSVLAKGGAMEHAMKCFGKAILSGPHELRVRHLQALRQVLTIDNYEALNADEQATLSAIVERWFNLLPPISIPEFQVLFDMFKLPLPEVALAVANIILGLTNQQWAQKEMARTSGFLEFLLSRDTLLDTEGRYTKFLIVDALLKWPTVDSAFDEAYIKKMKTYVAEGPHYVRREAEVATE